jgi:hypothetical protein
MVTNRQSATRRVVVEADSRGRISLAKFGIKDAQLVIEELSDGSLAIHPAVVLTAAEARHYSNPEAVAALDRALAAASAGNTRSMQLRSQRD